MASGCSYTVESPAENSSSGERASPEYTQEMHPGLFPLWRVKKFSKNRLQLSR